MSDKSSLERLVPDELKAGEVTGAETLALHLERYQFATQYVIPGRLLDMACGVGYGSRLLKDHCSQISDVTGVDLESEAIAYANSRYATEGVCFQVHDAITYSDSRRFDTVVSLETIEHLPSPDAFLDNLLARVIRPGGRLICSVPVTPSVDANPHHLHDFSERSFRKMLVRRGLTEIAHLRQIQPFKPTQVLRSEEARTRDLRRNLLGYYATHPTSLYRRIATTLRYGFQNRYLTVAWSAPE